MMRFLYILSITIFLCSCNNTPTHIPTLVSQCKDIPVGRASAIAWSVGGKGYVLGGRDSANILHNDLWEYNPITDSWQNLGETPLMPRVNGVACVANGTVYVGLGFHQSIYQSPSYLQDWWEYDPIDNTWNKLPDYPNQNTVKPNVYVQENKIYCVHGFGVGFTADIVVFDITSNQWSCIKRPQYIDRACMAGTGAMLQNRCYYGTGYNTKNLNYWYEIDFNGKWIKRANVPGKRQMATCVATNKYIYLAGGRKFGGTLTDGKIYNDILRYDIHNDLWTYAGTTQSPAENCFGFTIDGVAYIGGGECDTHTLNTLYKIED